MCDVLTGVYDNTCRMAKTPTRQSSFDSISTNNTNRKVSSSMHNHTPIEGIKNNESDFQNITSTNMKKEGKQVTGYNYHLRKDVVVKTIFRKARKHHVVRFKCFYDYTKLKWSNKIDAEQILMNKIDEYLRLYYPSHLCSDMRVLFLSFLDPKCRYVGKTYDTQRIRTLVYMLIYKFNRSVIEELFSIPQFMLLITEFVETPNVMTNFKPSEKTQSAYRKQINVLKSVCQNTSRVTSRILITLL